jgi:undecaprenyl-diphosphatase
MFDWLNKIDTQLFLSLNGKHSPFFDAFFTLFTTMETWFPLYVLILIIIFKKYRQQGVWILLFFVLTIVLSDQLSGLIKDLVHRLRPSQDPLLAGKVNIPASQGGLYGFVSGHAANSFALTFLLGFLSRNRKLFLILFAWSLVICYSRIYVGVHYPLDVICGGTLGALIGWSMYKLLILFDWRFQQKTIKKAGAWKQSEIFPIEIALLFIVITLLIAAKIIVKRYA